ncbi:MAG: hypothetical protein LBH98_03130 [Chitinispirillales bacterium]|nr:hypothetical protein [Chitinispirillales bacterium]
MRSYENNELYQSLKIFFGAQGRPPRIKISFDSIDGSIENKDFTSISNGIFIKKSLWNNGDVKEFNETEWTSTEPEGLVLKQFVIKQDGNAAPSTNFSNTYNRVAEDDNEWYHLILTPSVRANCDVDDIASVINEKFFDDVHFSTLNDNLELNIIDGELVTGSTLAKLLDPKSASSKAVGTVKNLLALNRDLDLTSLKIMSGNPVLINGTKEGDDKEEYILGITKNKPSGTLKIEDIEFVSESGKIAYPDPYVKGELKINDVLKNYAAIGVFMELAVREGGTYNPCYMSLSPAFNADKLSSNRVKDVIDNNANCYHTLAGRTVFENGRCTGTYVLGAQIGENNMGEWVDTVIFIDLMRARLQEAIFGTLKSASDAKSKIPFTQSGIDLLHFAASTLLNAWVAGGQLQSWSSDNTPASQITPEQRAGRRFEGLRYNCKLAGAINTVVINVNLED